MIATKAGEYISDKRNQKILQCQNSRQSIKDVSCPHTFSTAESIERNDTRTFLRFFQRLRNPVHRLREIRFPENSSAVVARTPLYVHALPVQRGTD